MSLSHSQARIAERDQSRPTGASLIVLDLLDRLLMEKRVKQERIEL